MPARSGQVRLAVTGGVLLAAAFVMAVLGAGWFTSQEIPSAILDWGGSLCFWGFIPVGLIGLIVLVLGLIRAARS